MILRSTEKIGSKAAKSSITDDLILFIDVLIGTTGSKDYSTKFKFSNITLIGMRRLT